MAVVDHLDWEQLARRVGGTYEAGPEHAPHALTVPVGAAAVHLDVYTWRGDGLLNGERRLRSRMPYVSPDDFRLHVRSKGTVARWLKLEDVSTGDAAFDEAFQVITSDTTKAERLLGDATGYRVARGRGESLRRRFLDHPWIELRVDEPEAWADDRRFAPGTLQASFETCDLVLVTEGNLVALVELFGELYEALVGLGSAEDRDPVRAADS